MSNKVIFNLDDLFISVGIDVGADFSWMSIALPNQQFVGKPYKILHSSIDSLTTAVSKIKEAEELYSLESRIFLESTGIYHYPLFCYLRDKGFNCSVINPIITKNSTNINIRKVHNDRFDSKKAALVGLKPDLKVSLMPSGLALNCRNLCREYYDLMDKPVESDYTFTAKDSSMEVEIAFTFNASELAGKELVTFEELYDLSNPDEPTKVAEHKDIEDEGQTVTITERIITMHTTATGKATGEKTIEADDKVTIVDTVTLDGLEKGVKYTLKGWEMVKSENAELLANGKRVENDLTFTATDTKMEVQIEFTFNASELAGKELVTFEELYDVTNPDEPIKVAEHKDIKDEGQTVTIKEKPESPTTPDEPSTPTKTSTSPKTGDNTPFAALFAMMGISAAGLIFACYKRFRRVKKSK